MTDAAPARPTETRAPGTSARQIAEYIDRLVSVEIRPEGLPRHTTLPVYEAARRRQNHPLTYLAAEVLRTRLHREDRVLLVTGASMPPWLPQGETDGPPGTAVLARALDLAVGAKPVFIAQPNHTAPLVAAARAVGLEIVDDAGLAARRHAGVVHAFPPGVSAGEDQAIALFARYSPAAVIFVEKVGPNPDGYYHGVLGFGREPDAVANVVPLVSLARERGVLTIGVGDGGNEIGFGLIFEDVRRLHPYGAVCRCPCGGGIATPVSTDVLVVAAVSNWGAYGIAANLAYTFREPDLLPSPEEEALLLQSCVQAGAADGATGRSTLAVDGIPLAGDVALVTLLRTIISVSLKWSDRSF